MKIYTKQNVFDAATERISWLFDEFDDIVVSFSGGKDSTVVLNLALAEATKRDRLPLRVLWLDQEAEWQVVVDYVKTVMYDPRVDPVWLQVPIKLFNATSATEQWLQCWDPEKDWMRAKDPISVKENTFGTDRFGKMFAAWAATEYPKRRVCFLAGVRAEESPARFVGLTSHATYKWATWGKMLSKKEPQVTMYPIVDWSYTDVWKAIHDHEWRYCGLYDSMFQRGVAVNNMRVSNVHHETAVHALYILQEIEPDTWAKLTSRLGGIATVGQLADDAFKVPKVLPTMFHDWPEYRDYLLENLIVEESTKVLFRKEFGRMDRTYGDMPRVERMHRQQIATILTNDIALTKLGTMERSPQYNVFRKIKAGKFVSDSEKARFGALLK